MVRRASRLSISKACSHPIMIHLLIPVNFLPHFFIPSGNIVLSSEALQLKLQIFNFGCFSIFYFFELNKPFVVSSNLELLFRDFFLLSN